jgi:hypothetical protein
MSWAPLPQPKPRGTSTNTIRLAVMQQGSTWKLAITWAIDGQDLPDWAYDTRVIAAIGAAEHDGWIRLLPDLRGVARVGRLMGRGTNGHRLAERFRMVKIPAGPYGGARRSRAEAADWKMEDAALLIALPPDWSRSPPAMAAAPAQTRQPRPALHTGPDPAVPARPGAIRAWAAHHGIVTSRFGPIQDAELARINTERTARNLSPYALVA